MKKFIAFVLTAALASPEGARLKDFASIEGVRDNQLIGYGIVVGLAGTGDKQLTLFSTQTLANMLERMGVTVNPTTIQVHNMASVMVTATLPPFAQPGTRIDATAAAIGDATNLQGGILLLTPLKAANGEVYAVAQGPEASWQAAEAMRRSRTTPPSAARPMGQLSNARRPRSNPRRI
jgi:flagellar P-ring protein precursor FlgI